MEEQEESTNKKLDRIARIATFSAFLAAYKMLKQEERQAWGITIFIMFLWYQYKYNNTVRKVCNCIIVFVLFLAVYVLIFPPKTTADIQQEYYESMKGK